MIEMPTPMERAVDALIAAAMALRDGQAGFEGGAAEQRVLEKFERDVQTARAAVLEYMKPNIEVYRAVTEELQKVANLHPRTVVTVHKDESVPKSPVAESDRRYWPLDPVTGERIVKPRLSAEELRALVAPK